MSVCARRDINKTALLCPDNFNNDDSSMVCMEYGGRRNRPQADRAGVRRARDAGGQHLSVSHVPRTLSSDLDVGLAGIFSIEWTVREGNFATLPRELVAISQVEFILAICLFAAAVFTYTHSRKLMVPLLGIAVAIMGFAAARVMFWPDSIVLRVALEVSYRIVTIAAAVQIVRYRWGRWEIGPWLVSACLLFCILNGLQ